MRYNRNNCTTVESLGSVKMFEILLCQHLAALIMLFVAFNSDVNGVSATPKIVWNGISFISHIVVFSCGFKTLTNHFFTANMKQRGVALCVWPGPVCVFQTISQHSVLLRLGGCFVTCPSAMLVAVEGRGPSCRTHVSPSGCVTEKREQGKAVGIQNLPYKSRRALPPEWCLF